MEHTAITLASVVFAGFACQWLSWRLKIPAILPLLAVGVLVGPVMQWFHPSEIVGDLLHPMVSLAVAIILFEGSLTLDFKEITKVKHVVQRLVSIGALVTWVIVAAAMHFVFVLDLSLSILFGALMVVTGPTVIVPLLRTVRPNANISNILRWEGILIDPVGALFAVLVFEFIVSSVAGGAISHVAFLFFKIIVVGTLIGFVAGKILEKCLEHHFLPEYLHNLATLALVLFSFSLANYFAEESGLLAVTVMGIWLANSKIHFENILNFKENLTVLLISILFITLAAELDLKNLIASGTTALGAYLVVQFVARPIAVYFSTLGSELSWQERALIAWVGPRGIIAAAISALFALKLADKGFADADLLVSLTFTVIIGTVLIQSLTAGFIGRMLGVSDPEPYGFLIVGATPLARYLADELSQNGIQVVITDSSIANIRAARMDGLKTFYGNPVSEYADQHLDLIGIGRLLAMSPQREINTIACMRYGTEFGRNKIFHIATSRDAATIEKHQTAGELRGQTLFGKDVTHKKLSSLLKAKELEIKTTRLSEEFNEADYDEKNPRAIKLMIIRASGLVDVITAGQNPIARPGDKIIAATIPKHKAASIEEE